MSSIEQRKQKSKHYKFIDKGIFNFNFPLSYNLYLGYSDRDFKLEERQKHEKKF